MKKFNLLINNKIYKNVFVAETFYERFKGLMFLSQDKSFNLLIKNCSSVHTCFMKFNIDIYCLDKNYKIIKIYQNIKPFRFVLPIKNVCHIFETPVK